MARQKDPLTAFIDSIPFILALASIGLLTVIIGAGTALWHIGKLLFLLLI